ncbi:MAG: hypothetical protein JF588_04095 [Caulobacterales bacterium]|nr:hypothetical protein [Caulobacterales bacterium]
MANIPNMQGGAGAPRLLVGLNLATLMSPPAWSRSPRGEPGEVLAAVKAAGFEAVQGRDPQAARAAGLVPTAIARLDRPQDARGLARTHKAAGCNALTLHVGTGFESDDEAVCLGEAVVEAAEAEAFPIYVETHRATLTQDMKRTLDLVERVPELRFNGDFSHWYTGQEMTYGDLAAKLERLRPVTDRTRFLHGRVSSPGAIQVGIGDGTQDANLEVFLTLWTRCFEGFLASAGPGEVFGFYPELLPAGLGYARLVPDGQGGLTEDADRWEEALLLADVARDCWRAAMRNSRPS